MTSRLLDIIEATDAATRDRAIDQWCAGRPVAELLAAVDELDALLLAEDAFLLSRFDEFFMRILADRFMQLKTSLTIRLAVCDHQ